MQDTIEITTPLKKAKVVLKGWITGEDELAIQNVYLSGTDVTATSEADQEMKMNGSLSIAAKKMALSIVVISVDGETDDVANKVLQLPASDYRFVQAEIDKITKGLDDSKKAE